MVILGARSYWVQSSRQRLGRAVESPASFQSWYCSWNLAGYKVWGLSWTIVSRSGLQFQAAKVAIFEHLYERVLPRLPEDAPLDKGVFRNRGNPQSS